MDTNPDKGPPKCTAHNAILHSYLCEGPGDIRGGRAGLNHGGEQRSALASADITTARWGRSSGGVCCIVEDKATAVDLAVTFEAEDHEA